MTRMRQLARTPLRARSCGCTSATWRTRSLRWVRVCCLYTVYYSTIYIVLFSCVYLGVCATFLLCIIPMRICVQLFYAFTMYYTRLLTTAVYIAR